MIWSAFPLLVRRVGKIFLLLLLFVPIAIWCALRTSMAISVHRGNVLLAKVKALKPRESTFDDAMRLAREFPDHPRLGDDKPCTSEDCTVLLDLGLWERPFYYEWRILNTMGIKYSSFGASVRVKHGRVIGKGFVAQVKAAHGTPYGEWLVLESELTDRFSSFDGEFDRGRSFGLEEHPNHLVLKPNLSTSGGGEALEAKVTADASDAEINTAFDFRLSCISSLRGCATLRDILPAEWDEYAAWYAQSSSPSPDDNDRLYGPCPLRTLARLARDMDNVVRVSVKRVFPSAPDDPRSQDVEFTLIETLKGQPGEHLSRMAMQTDLDEHTSGRNPRMLPSHIFSPGQPMLLFLKDSEVDFAPYPYCETVPATEENLTIVRQTLDELSRGAPITALRAEVSHK